MRRALLVLPAVLILAACDPVVSSSGGGGAATASPTTAAASGRLATGPGPQGHYSVQAQPPAGSCHYRHEHDEPLPDRTCTPGAVSPAVTQANLRSTICRSGYTKTVRPSVSVTAAEKRANEKSYSYTGPTRTAEYDHLVSLELGGDPNDPRNLWLEPPGPGQRGTYNDKDTVEAKLHTAVCSGRVKLSAAQQAIASDWTTALAGLGLG